MLRGALAATFAALCSVSGVAFGLERDFDGDLRADILWRHQGAGGTGENYIYPMNGKAILAGEGYVRTVADMSWEVAEIGDFNGDGEADILWRNQATGQNYIYFMSGRTIAAEGYIRTVADQNWKIVGVGDFDGDGRSDILWRNFSTGENYIYPMDGLAILAGEGYIRTVADMTWNVAGIGDFNGDGEADILWRNQATGQNYIYPMNGRAILAGEGYVRTVADMSWEVAGIGDFNGDGEADILWRNQATGQNYIYFMSGRTIAAEGYIRTVADQNWQVVGVGDYDGDGKADILWRNASTGENYLYPMNGTAILPSEGYLRTVADRDWKVQPAPACPAVSSNAITVSAVASRVSGVAPLAVFFDATATIATTTTRPFHELEYQWNFGDAGSGLWSSTPDMPNLSRNLATGPLAAHVFEKPGTYSVCLTVFDGANTATTSLQVTVTDPDTVFAPNTLCVGASSEPVADSGGCPAGAAVLQSSDFDAAINNNIASRQRILFKRGDTFDSDADAYVSVDGPGLIGAFGTGNAPIVNVSGLVTFAVVLSTPDTPTLKDWRIMDLEINGNSGVDTQGVLGLGGMDQITILRLNIHHVNVGVKLSPFFLDAFNLNGAGHTLWDQVAVVDSTIRSLIGVEGGNGVYIGAQRFAFMGNVIDDTTGAEHVTRWPYLYKAVLSHNSLSNPAQARVVVKLQAWPFNVNVTDASEWIVLSDNKVTTSTAWAVVLGPQDTELPEIVRHVIVERNWFAPNAAQQVAVFSMGEHHTIRNNVFDLSGTSERKGVTVGPFPHAIHGTRSNVHIYNNTFFSSSPGNFRPIIFEDGSGHIARNNVGYAPLATSGSMVLGTGYTESNNTTDVLVSPSFVGLAPAIPADFRLGAGSSAIGAGAAVPVFSDLFRRGRPQNALFDLGAAETP